eukprot:2324380-Pyramimonas_sp.AAC.1
MKAKPMGGKVDDITVVAAAVVARGGSSGGGGVDTALAAALAAADEMFARTKGGELAGRGHEFTDRAVNSQTGRRQGRGVSFARAIDTRLLTPPNTNNGYDVDVKGYDVDVKGYGVDVKGYDADVCVQAVADKAIEVNAENAEKQQRLRDKIAAREREFQESLLPEEIYPIAVAAAVTSAIPFASLMPAYEPGCQPTMSLMPADEPGGASRSCLQVALANNRPLHLAGVVYIMDHGSMMPI